MKSIQRAVFGLTFIVFPFSVAADWTLARDESSVSYLSSKMTAAFSTVFENNRFRVFSGAISDAGDVTLDIDLNSVDTGVPIRDERVKEHAFDAGRHPTATIKASVGPVDKRLFGRTQTVEAALTMRGVTRQVRGEVSVTRDDGRLLVQTVSPIPLNAVDYGMAGGFEILKGLVKLFNIPTTIPVSFKLVFVKE